MSLQDRMQKYMADLDREVNPFVRFYLMLPRDTVLTRLAVQVSFRCPIRAESRCVKGVSCPRYWLRLLLPHLLELRRTNPVQPCRIYISW